MSTYPPNQTTPKSGNYLWNWLGSPLKKFAAALSPYMGGGDAGVKKYVATLNQSFMDDPVATVLENTLGQSITWSRTNVGQYQGTAVGAFPDGKTSLIINQSGSGNCITNSVADIGGDVIFIYTGDLSGSLSDSILYYATIEIRVYP